MKVRSFKKSDLQAVHQLIHLTIDVAYTPVYPQGVVAFFKSYHSQDSIIKRFHKGSVLVIEHDGDIVGTGSLVDYDIQGVFIHPDFQQQGLGKKLMCALEKEAQSKKFKEVTLDISLPSKQFYQDIGYTVIEECSFEVDNGDILDYWTATKLL